MPASFKIHPAIGIARLGDSPTAFYLCPETVGQLPIDCDANGVPLVGPDGREKRIEKFKDAEGRIKRQAARFHVFVYDETSPQGRELKIGEKVVANNKLSGQQYAGTVLDIQWTVYLANKKACWYEFEATQGEHGYAPDHPLRNADITDPSRRQQLIIDPGPITVGLSGLPASGEFARGKNTATPQCFPPPLQPCSIDTLGGVKVYAQDNTSRLIVLGGHGNSGSFKTGFGNPSVQKYANNDGWFDDTSDGPVTAQILMQVDTVDGRTPTGGSPYIRPIPVNDSAWVIVGYPRYAPEIADMVTMDDLVYDLAVRNFNYNPLIYSGGKFNPGFIPYFWRDIWPIISRPQDFSWVMEGGGTLNGGDPHNATRGANLNLDPDQLSVAPYQDEPEGDRIRRAGQRQFVYGILRKQGDENDYMIDNPTPFNPRTKFAGMPKLCGDNPMTNTVPSKFLRLTDTQLFFMKQWAAGKFINERTEMFPPVAVPPGEALDRGVLSTMLGGAFCPGAETTWIMRNPQSTRRRFESRPAPPICRAC